MQLTRRQVLTAGSVGAGLLVARPALAADVGCDAVPSTHEVFTHGVASGDPTMTSVVLWTRVAPQLAGRPVRWLVRDPAGVVAARGTVRVPDDADGTVQVAVEGLTPGTRWSYEFSIAGAVVGGRTKTLPADPSTLRIGVVSCSKYADGYFNAYRALAAMDVDLVLHLGDYIYASPTSAGGDPLGRWEPIADRYHQPARECTELDDYRTRYQQYRSDPDLQALHASVPVVAIWDDNDIANNAYRDGNQAGQTGASWYARKRAGQRAWREWLPSQVGAPDADGNLRTWRRIRSGGLLDLLMLDTRLQRDQQVSNAPGGSTAANDDPDRTMLGAEQLGWVQAALAEDTATWRVLGQGIVMTHWRIVGGPEDIGRLRREVDLVHDTAASQAVADGGVYWNSDGWDGYTHERGILFDTFAEAPGNVVVLTGDVHSSWANELVPDANVANRPVGVEFVTPAAATRSFASNVSGATAPFEAMFTAANPWIKQVDMDANGFLVMTLTEERAVGEWFQVDAQTPGAPAAPLMAWQTAAGTNALVPSLGL